MNPFNKNRDAITLAVTSLLALGSLSAVQAASAADFEKCAGIAAAGKNDCGTSVSSCAGTAKVDRDAHTWILVPKGTCVKIAGGVVTTDPNAKHGGAGGK
jgi:uncharacterized membrane protein